MDRLFVHPRFAELWAATGAKTVAETAAKFFPDHEGGQKVTVHRITLTGAKPVEAFIKLYQHRGDPWRFWMRRSKARCEFENYLTFERLGVSAADVIACGEERDALGRLRRDFIVTRAVPKCRGLADFFRDQPSWEQRRCVLADLAGIVRRLHTADFFYYDLVWRNLLVSEEEGHAKVFLIDCPRGGVSRFGRQHRVLRDLASLDKVASQLCSRTERLRFLLLYLGKKLPDGEARALADACLEYRRKRWPEDWQGS